VKSKRRRHAPLVKVICMNVEHVTPILNVSSLEESFEWFEKLGWTKDWDYGDPPDFGAVRNGECDIFLCKDGQGSHGDRTPVAEDSDYTKGTWIALRLPSPAAIDALHARAQQLGLTVTEPPTDKPWNMREVHIRHPDGHTLRIGALIEEE
jgi:catechol 2,3-dioxygenase-like lactoylglutathione lyase family enzyme